jgi:hypothetical protein
MCVLWLRVFVCVDCGCVCVHALCVRVLVWLCVCAIAVCGFRFVLVPLDWFRPCALVEGGGVGTSGRHHQGSGQAHSECGRDGHLRGA